jgi:hypothetical protein
MPATGERCRETGLYVAECVRHHREPQKVKFTKAEVFSPCPEKGCTELVVWKLVVPLP